MERPQCIIVCTAPLPTSCGCVEFKMKAISINCQSCFQWSLVLFSLQSFILWRHRRLKMGQNVAAATRFHIYRPK